MKAAARFATRPSVGSVAASVLVQGALVISGPLTARLLGLTGRGDLAILVIAASIGSFCGALGMPTAVAYTVSREGLDASVVLRLIAPAWAALCLAAGTVTALVVVALIPAAPGSPAWVSPVLVGVCVVTAMNWQLVLASVQGEHRFRLLNALRPLSVLLSTAGITGLWLTVRHTTVAPTYAVTVAAGVVSNIAGWWLLSRGSGRGGTAPKATRWSVIRFGLASVAGANAPLEALSLDQAVVGIVLPRMQLGLYAVASSFDNAPAILLSGLGTIALPRVAGAPDRAARAAAMRRMTILAVALAGATAVGTEIVVGPLLPFAFGGSFAGAIPAARILIVAGFFLALRRILVVFLQGVGAPGHTGVGEVIALVVLVVAALILVPALGLAGASLALLAAALSASAYVLWRLTRAVATAPKDPEPRGADLAGSSFS